MSKDLFKLTDVYKSFYQLDQEIKVLKGIDFIVNKGETIAIIGASGVGKSTLLHIMGSLERPSKGKVYFEGRDLYGMSPKELERVRNKEIGFVFQFHYLIPEFTALENVMFPGMIAGEDGAYVKERALEALKMVGLEKKTTQLPGELSGGEQQRVAIARAIVMKPKVVLADEPTGNLDWETGEDISKVLLSLNQELGIALVLVTHNMRLASLMTRRMELADGKIYELH